MSNNKPNRAIDRHEDSICAVLDNITYAGTAYEIALIEVADEAGLTPERLDSLVRVWCAIAGCSDLLPPRCASAHVA